LAGFVDTSNSYRCDLLTWASIRVKVGELLPLRGARAFLPKHCFCNGFTVAGCAEVRGMSVVIVKFGDFELDFDAFQLRRSGFAVKIEGLPLRLLMMLVTRRGELVSRSEIEKELWGAGVFVDVTQGINTAIRKIRLVLRDHSNKPRYLQTVVGKGYRFLASEVVEVTDSAMIADTKGMVTLEELGEAILAAAGLQET
jgi:DNA-binding winged helix-turn-helix (wHTH) protein